jgi:hypothetical protein
MHMIALNLLIFDQILICIIHIRGRKKQAVKIGRRMGLALEI